MDSQKGTVSTVGPLDRETRSLHVIPIYALDSGIGGAVFDITTLLLTVTDINDHAPRFTQAACRLLAVPENSDLAPIRTMVAIDEDEGLNAQITYSITGILY